MKPLTLLSLFVFFVLAGFVSCTRETVAINTPSGKSLLMAHTWRLQEVTELVAGKKIVVYRQGSGRNAEDYSLVRQSYKQDGTVQFVDQFGNVGTDGEYELSAGNHQIRLALGTENLVGEAVSIGTEHFTYTVKLSEEDAVCYRFCPNM